MSEIPRDELISALLDGELTGKQRREAEQLLADDPDCRQLYDELQLVRAAVSSLPRHKLPKDISRRVLRRAERRMSPGAAQLARASREAASIPSLSTAEATWRRDWRTVLWPALAIAAALLLLVFNSGTTPPDDPLNAGRGVIAQKAPATGPRAGNRNQADQGSGVAVGGEEQAADTALVATRPAGSSAMPGATAIENAPGQPQPTRAATAATGPADVAVSNAAPIIYLVAEVQPAVARDAAFHATLTSQEFRLEELRPRRVRPGTSMTSSAARSALSDAGRNGEAVYTVTGPRDRVERVVLSVREQNGIYTVLQDTLLPSAASATGPPPVEAASGEQQTAGNIASSAAVARRFATREDAEMAARQAAVRSSAIEPADVLTVIVVLRSVAVAPESTDASAAPGALPDGGRD